MNAAPTDRAYKVISLLIKAGILILSFWYVFYKLKSTGSQIDFAAILKQSDVTLLGFTFCLMFVNWGLEALKWKLLIAPLENITFFTAFKSVFAGVTISIFMPNRIGEFAGRIFFLDKAGKVEATLKNFVGACMQLLITLLMGVPALAFFVKSSEGCCYSGGNTMLLISVTGPVCAMILLFFLLRRYRYVFSQRLQSYLNAFDIPFKTLLTVFFISWVRYCVFLFQYYLVLCAFNIHVDLYFALPLIAATFLITSVIPSFAFTEVVTRGAVAVTLFASVTNDAAAVIAASFTVWIINLAIPALTGSLFIGKMKFFKS